MNSVLIIGFGIAGKRFFKILKKKKIDILVLRKSNKKIIYQKKNISLIYKKFNRMKLNKFDGVIISSPPETHWKYLNILLKENIDIIVEKPVIDEIFYLPMLKKLFKNFNNNFYINHSDLYDRNFKSMVVSKKIFKDIKEIKFNYGNGKNKYKNSLKKTPTNDWLPHVLAVIYFFLKKIDNYRICSFTRKIINNLIYEKTLIKFYSRGVVSTMSFSNFPNRCKRNFSVKFSRGMLNFDCYKKNSFIISNRKKIFFNENLNNSFENLIDCFLLNFKKKKKNTDFFLFNKYSKLYHSISEELKYTHNEK